VNNFPIFKTFISYTTVKSTGIYTHIGINTCSIVINPNDPVSIINGVLSTISSNSKGTSIAEGFQKRMGAGIK